MKDETPSSVYSRKTARTVVTSCDPPARSKVRHRPRGGSRSCATVRTPRAEGGAGTSRAEPTDYAGVCLSDTVPVSRYLFRFHAETQSTQRLVGGVRRENHVNPVRNNIVESILMGMNLCGLCVSAWENPTLASRQDSGTTGGMA